MNLLLIKTYTFCLFLIGALFLNYTVDDAFISFRYGKNLIDLGIWNWNLTDKDVVEAYTNPIFAALSIIPHWLNFNVVILFKLLGILLLYLTYKVLSHSLSEYNRWLSAAYIATNILIFPHAFSGLETIAFFLPAFYLMTLDDKSLSHALPSWIILIAPLIRPEGALLSFYIIYKQIVNRNVSVNTLAAISVGIVYFYIRYAYFGYLLPNTFYAKTGGGISTFIINFCAETVVIGAWGISLIFIVKQQGRLFLPILLFMGYLLANLPADLQMNYGHRFAWHLLFPTIFYAFWLAVRDKDNKPLGDKPVALPVLFILAFMVNIKFDLFRLVSYYPDAIASHQALGQMLSKYKKSDPVMATGDAGLIPYYSGLRTIDYVGLANTEVAHALHERRPPIIAAPDMLTLYSKKESSCDTADHALEQQFLWENALKQSVKLNEYTCVPGPRFGTAFYLNVLVKKNFPEYKPLIADIGQVKKAAGDRTMRDRIKDILFFKGLR